MSENDIAGMLFGVYTLLSIIIRATPTHKDDMFMQNINSFAGKIQKILKILNSFFSSSFEIGKSQDQIKMKIACLVLHRLSIEDQTILKEIEVETKRIKLEVDLFKENSELLLDKNEIETIIENNIRS